MKNLISCFLKDESAATAIEYGLPSTLNSAQSARSSAEATRIATALKETAWK
jgi:hypothetical protein